MQHLKLAISIDVEEDGLFSGRYPAVPPGVGNVNDLGRLSFATQEFGIPLTLLVTYPVAQDPACCDLLKRLHKTGRAEIGAHLHPWCTPPFSPDKVQEPAPMSSLPADIVRGKLDALLESIRRNIGVKPVSFRAGRFDLSRQLLRLLPESGIAVDSSVVPLRPAQTGPENYPARSPDPHPHPDEPGILEAPITMTPIWPTAASTVFSDASNMPTLVKESLFAATRYLNSAGIHPAWFSLPVMKKATRLHAGRGGRVLNMFLHSSELSPGATPLNRTPRAAASFAQKIRRYIEWLRESFEVQGVTLSELVSFNRGCEDRTTL